MATKVCPCEVHLQPFFWIFLIFGWLHPHNVEPTDTEGWLYLIYHVLQNTVKFLQNAYSIHSIS